MFSVVAVDGSDDDDGRLPLKMLLNCVVRVVMSVICSERIDVCG